MMTYDEGVDYLLKRLKNTAEQMGGNAVLDTDFVRIAVDGVELEFEVDRKSDEMPIYVVIKKELNGDYVYERKPVNTYILSRFYFVSNHVLSVDLKGLVAIARELIGKTE